MESPREPRGTDPSRPGGTRRYRMRARQEEVDQTRERILQAMVDLWLERHYDDVSLADVAEAAGVSRQTVYRQFGNKDDLLVAAAEWKGPQAEASMLVPPGDLEGAVRALVSQYEVMGDANVRALQQEGRVHAMDQLLKRGREAHRAWIEQVFGPSLPSPGDEQRESAVMAFYAATDVMVWKLLRRDFNLPRAGVEAVLRRMLEALVAAGPGDAREDADDG